MVVIRLARGGAKSARSSTWSLPIRATAATAASSSASAYNPIASGAEKDLVINAERLATLAAERRASSRRPSPAWSSRPARLRPDRPRSAAERRMIVLGHRRPFWRSGLDQDPSLR